MFYGAGAARGPYCAWAPTVPLKEKHRHVSVACPRGWTRLLQDLRFAIRLISKERPVFGRRHRGAGAWHWRERDRLHDGQCGVPARPAIRRSADRLYMLSWRTRSRPRFQLLTNQPVSGVAGADPHVCRRGGVYTSFPMNISDDRAWPEAARGARTHSRRIRRASSPAIPITAI